MTEQVSVDQAVRSFVQISRSLNVIGPPKIMGSVTIRRCGFPRIGRATLEEMCHCRSGL